MDLDLTICGLLSGKLQSRELSWFIYLIIIITFKVLGIVGRGFKSLLFSVKVYEPLPEIQLSKLIGAMQFCNHLET